jgi:hypothetical protein
MGRCNPRQVLPINTCGRYGSSNTQPVTKNTNTSRFYRFYCCVAEATSSHSSTCICDQKSRSPEPLSSAILHQKRVNRVFKKLSSWLLSSLCQFFHQCSSISSSVACRGSSSLMRTSLGRSLFSSDRHRQGTASHVWFLLSNHVLHI